MPGGKTYLHCSVKSQFTALKQKVWKGNHDCFSLSATVDPCVLPLFLLIVFQQADVRWKRHRECGNGSIHK